MDFTRLKSNLENNGFTVTVFETGKEAAEYLNGQIDEVTVASGGSVTLKEIGLIDMLSSHNDYYTHWNATDPEERKMLSQKAQTADIYLSSVNGISEEGEIINIDGSGNRVSGVQYGHKKVYLVIGKNKVAENYDAALYRARNIAAPLNAKRLRRKTPCAEKGDRCYNCNSPERICRGLSVLWKKPSNCDYEIVLVNEDLGF